jgi:hypothetical protein
LDSLNHFEQIIIKSWKLIINLENALIDLRGFIQKGIATNHGINETEYNFIISGFFPNPFFIEGILSQLEDFWDHEVVDGFVRHVVETHVASEEAGDKRDGGVDRQGRQRQEQAARRSEEQVLVSQEQSVFQSLSS